MARRIPILVCLCLSLVIFCLVSFTHHGQLVKEAYTPSSLKLKEIALSFTSTGSTAHPKVDKGDAIMPKLLNATLKADLGRHSWYLFHTVLSRYPESPSQSEREDLAAYIKYFTKLYPCGDCATHFQSLLQDYPPQTSSRIAAAQWGCAVHNKVNERLKKPIYDCSGILEDYDCGCGSNK